MQRFGFLCLLLSLVLINSAFASAQTTCASPPAGMIAWWPFDETSGTVAADIVGTKAAVYSGGPVPSPGQAGGALRFNGNSNFVTASDSDQWAFGTGNFTIELWANWDAPGGGDIVHAGDIFIGSDEGPGNRNKWFFALGGGVLHFTVYNTASPPPNFYLVRAPFSPVVGQWYHLAITKSGTLFTIFVNGVPIGSEISNSPIANAGAALTIGQAESIGFMNGRLDEVTVYSRSLTAGELTSIYSSGAAGKCKPLLVRPDRGGDTGRVSVTISGGGLASGTSMKLERIGSADIPAISTAQVGGGMSLAATFDLTGRPRGVWDVVVTYPDLTHTTLPGAFTIEEGRGADLWTDIVGLPVIRINREQTYWLIAGNQGNVDAEFFDRTLDITAGLFLEDGAETGPILAQSFQNPDASQISCADLEKARLILQARLDEVNRLLAEAEAALGTTTNEKDRQALRNQIRNLKLDRANFERMLKDIVARLKRCSENPPPEEIPRTEPIVPIEPTQFHPMQINAPLQGCYILQLLLSSMPLPTGGPAAALASAATSLTSPTHLSSTSTRICTVTSFDPNDKSGSSGAGVERFVSYQEPLRYSISFENKETATAPAQEVTITDQLDTATLDLNAFALGPITFGNRLIVPPPGASLFSTYVDLRPTTNLLVNIEAALNKTTGLGTWRFKSIDPATGNLPANPLAGFLPPNVAPPQGNGSVLFTIAPKDGLATGTLFLNSASIIFDLNAAILTPEWSNTLDAAPPISHVQPLAAQSQNVFTVRWSGTDAGAGIKDFTVYVSDNSAPFTPWLIQTIATESAYTGAAGHSYGFYTIARDLAGNVESIKMSDEAITRVLLADTTLPVIVPGFAGTLGDNDWYRSNVTVVWSVSDSESGITSSSGCNETILTADTPSVTLTCSATNGAGQSRSVLVTVKIDQTPPVATATASPIPNAGGWNNTNVNLSFSGTDALSGIEFCTAPITLLGDGAGQSASGTCTDKAGNVSAPVVKSGINIDKTSPTSHALPLPATQSSLNFLVQWSGTDVVSGVQDFTIYVSDNGGSFASWLLNTTATQATYAGLNGHTYSFYSLARDRAGNIESAKTSAEATTRVVLDTTSPLISGMPAADCKLWPANHKMIKVATVTATRVTAGSLRVTGGSNEPSDPKDPDILITPNGAGGFVVQLRADRLGTGTGRIYTLTATATDLVGNPVKATATCVVPHDQGK